MVFIKRFKQDDTFESLEQMFYLSKYLYKKTKNNYDWQFDILNKEIVVSSEDNVYLNSKYEPDSLKRIIRFFEEANE